MKKAATKWKVNLKVSQICIFAELANIFKLLLTLNLFILLFLIHLTIIYYKLRKKLVVKIKITTKIYFIFADSANISDHYGHDWPISLKA